MPTVNRKQIIILGFLGIFLLGTVIYSNILHAPFIFDEYSSIVNNESIRSIAESLKNISSNRYLTLLSFAINYAVSGLKPFGYHLTNNLIHIINALLVYYLVINTFKTPFFRGKEDDIHPSRYFIAFSSAFIFVAHPIQTQAVTYVVQRATSMATMFYLLSLVMYVKFRIQDSGFRIQDKSPQPQFIKGGQRGITKIHESCVMHLRPKLRAHRLKSVLCYLASVICAIFSMKTKEIAFTLPVMVVLYEFCFLSATSNSKLRTPNWKKFLYLFPILLTILIIPFSMLNIKGPGEGIVQDIDIQSRETINISRTDYLMTQFRVGITYLRLLIFPVDQNFDYDYPVYHSFFNPELFISFFVLVVVFCFGIYLLHRSRFRNLDFQSPSSRSRFTNPVLRLIAFSIFWFFITLSVESSIIPVRDVIVEHRLYLPSVGFFIASVSLVDYLLPFRSVKIALIILIVVFLSVGTYTRNAIWKDPQTLWEDVIAKAPHNSRAYNNLGIIYKETGEFDRAIELFEKSLEADRNYTAVYYNLGDVQYRLGNYENAIAYLNQALTGKLNPQLHLDILNKIGRTYGAMGQPEKAIETFEKAVKLFPSSIVLLNNLGVEFIKNNQIDSAIEIYEKAINIEEKAYLYNNLALAYAQKGDEEKSRLMRLRALELSK